MEEPNKNVIILQDEPMNNRPRRWTFRRYLKGIPFGKWWIIGSTAVLALAGYLGTRFLLNNLRSNVSSTFSYNNIALVSDNRGGGAFVDGARFDYASLISTETLKSVKDSDPSFASVNLEKLSQSITISMESYTDKNTGETVYVTPNRFTIAAKLAAFGSEPVARNFMNRLIETTNDNAKAAVARHEINTSVPANFSELSFIDQINHLEVQRGIIKDEIEGLIDSFTGNGIISETGTRLTTYKTDFQNAFNYLGVDYFTYLEDSLEVNKWVNFTDDTLSVVISRYTETADGYIERMRLDLSTAKTKQKAIDDMISASGGMIISGSEFAALIAQYQADIVDIELKRADYLKELKDLGYTVDTFKADPTEENLATIVLSGSSGTLNKLMAIKNGTADAETKEWGANCAAFAEEINVLKASIIGENSYSSSTTAAYRYLYNTQRSNVNYYTANVVAVSGAISPWIGLAAGLVIGFLASSLIVAAVYINKIDPIVDETEKNKAGK